MRDSVNFLRQHSVHAVLIAILLFYTVAMTGYVIEMNNQYVQAGDLAAYNHVIWNVAKNATYESSLCGSVYEFANVVAAKSGKEEPNVPDNFSVFSLHYIPGIALTNALPFFVKADVNTTLFIQTLALAICAFLIFQISILKGLNPWVGVGLAFSFLFNPANLGANVNAFHPIVMALPFLLGMVLALEKNSWILYWVCFSVAILIQENVSTVLLVASVLPFLNKNRKTAAAQLVISGIFFVLVTRKIIPSYNPAGICPYCSIYGSPMGGSLDEILRNAILNPALLIQTVFREPVITWFLKLLLPLVLTPLFAPHYLLIALVSLAPNFLTSNAAMHMFWGQYNALAMPFLYVGAIVILARIQRWISPVKLTSLSAGIAVLSFYLSVQFAASNYTDPRQIFNLRSHQFRSPQEIAQFDEIRDHIPAQASLSANEYLLGQLHYRKEAYIFPVHHLKADFVVFDKKSPYPSLLSQERLEEMIQENREAGYRLVLENQLFYLFQRESPAGP